MKKLMFTIINSVSLLACASNNQEVWDYLELNPPSCGRTEFNNQQVERLCLTKDVIAPKIKQPIDVPNWIQVWFGAGHTGAGRRISIGATLELKNQELDMQNHVWDFFNQNNPSLIFRGHDSIIKNGVILNANISLGGGYSTPNFSTNTQNLNYIDNNQFSYAKESDEKPIKNMFINNFNNQANSFRLTSWEGGIEKSKLIINERINVDGSKATILNNQIISKAELGEKTVRVSKGKYQTFDIKMFALTKINKSKFIGSSTQIFPDANDDNTAIPSVLYVKFSPETVIDGNTFTLTHPNPNAYAIVLDHSPRVRITNNTFNGFKVPILMDQWSSIVDEHGNELSAEQFNNQGNILNPNQFAGDVTMNRKGEIVKK